MDLEQVIAKYTGHHVTHRQLEMAMRGGGLTAELAMGIGSTAEAVRATENELIRVCDAINRHTATAVQVITADAGQPHRQPSRLDELQNAGVRFDALLAVRSAQLAHLHRLLQLGRPLPSVDVSQPGPPR